MKYLLTSLLFSISFLVCAQTTKVLFLGNSYTGNTLTPMFQELCLAAGDAVYVKKNTPGGCSLAAPPNSHLENQTSLGLIAEGIWDYVILQEQSQMPTIPYYRSGYFFPGARILDSLINVANPCTRTMFYMTWGRKYGGQQCIGSYCSPVFADYEHMQDSLEAAYMRNAVQNDASVSPVGISWKNSILNGEPIDLFAADGSHPSEAGFYLSACTFYAAIFLKSPVGLEYHAGLDPDDALYLQQVAEFTVLTNPEEWLLEPMVKPLAGYEYLVNADTVFFTDTSYHSNEYFWDFGDGNTSALQNPYNVYEQSGFYEVLQVVSDSCNSDSTSKLINVVVSGIQENRSERLQVYPNPAADVIFIKTPDPGQQSPGNVFFEIYSVDGRKQKSGSCDNMKIKLGELDSGLYIIHIYSQGGKKHTGKIVKR